MRMVIILNSLMLGSIDTVGFKDKGALPMYFFVAEHCVDGSFVTILSLPVGDLMPCLSSSLTMPKMLMPERYIVNIF